ncbi:MAG TPA: hypothetical protein VNI01_15975, partial [Elusimicrobiota bacterium]|nr:hypothetical protein [Elusimicrobiota bacterium]
MNRLHACWTPPRPLPGPEETVLSFLPPLDEDAFSREFKGKLLLARSESTAVRAQARALYLRLGADMGATPDSSGRTLRADCGGDPSPWWWHPSSFKDPESDPAFGLLIAALTVERAAAGQELVLHGAPGALERVLRARAPYSSWCGAFIVLRALAARLRTAFNTLRETRAASSVPAAPPPPGGAALFGFWDWSPSPSGKELSDRYYKALPQELARRGVAPFWLCWLDPEGDPAARGRQWDQVLAPLAGRTDVVLLQRWLRPADIFEAFLDFRPARAYLRRRRNPAFRSLFKRGSLDLWPLFAERLLRGFFDGCLPRCELVRRASARAAADLRPSLLASFLEHFPVARALYAGARAGLPGVRIAAIQHASYAAEKAFLFLEPAREFRGEPDGLPAPTPDVALTMGSASREYFLSCGYPTERVLLTGSPRYDALRTGDAASRRGDGVRVLCV